MQHYVMGFLFDHVKQHVLLIHKKRPQFQAGLWNGVGGKVEPHEHSHQAMQRECAEECGIWVSDWNLICHVVNPAYQIDVWSACADLSDARTCTDESVQIHAIHTIWDLPTLNNLPMLMAMALDTSSCAKPIWIYD